MRDPIRVLCIGAGNMGRSHAKAYHQDAGFEIVGICTRSTESATALNDELQASYPCFTSVGDALKQTGPDAVCVASYPDTHAQFTLMALEHDCHVFVEKPLATTVESAEQVISLAQERQRKVVVGYILRHHPSWQKFIELARTLGKPMVMRMNLNQQSSGDAWQTHRSLMSTISPIVDCGVHYVDVMCQMTRSKPVRVSGIAARLSSDVAEGIPNYGQLQVTFADGSVGWYEAGWGPMMSETAFFVKDAIGPRGSVSIVADTASKSGKSASVDAHTQTESLRYHSAELDNMGHFKRNDELIRLNDEPNHDELCAREQSYFQMAIRDDINLTAHLQDALNSMRIVLAAEESFRTGSTIEL